MRRPAIAMTVASALLALLLAGPARTETATIAVATNFAAPMQAVQQAFERRSSHALTVALGSTGQLYAQIVYGAPFDAMLAADQERPALLAEWGRGDPTSVFTYAVGRLVLCSNRPAALADRGLDLLRAADLRRLAIANPQLAPYGAAARQVLDALDLWQQLEPRVVRAENVGQAFSLVATGNADAGLLAMSHVIDRPDLRCIEVPAALHEPIKQDAILLRRGAANAAAIAFLVFLRSDEAKSVIRSFGYHTPDSTATAVP